MFHENALPVIFEAVNRWAETPSRREERGTRILTFSQHDVPADFGNEAVTDLLGIGMRVLFTTYSHRAGFRPQVRSECENQARCCQDFSTNSANIFPQKMLAVWARGKTCRAAAGS